MICLFNFLLFVCISQLSSQFFRNLFEFFFLYIFFNVKQKVEAYSSLFTGRLWIVVWFKKILCIVLWQAGQMAKIMAEIYRKKIEK